MVLASASEWVGTTGTGEDGTVVTTELWADLPPLLNRSLSLRKDSIAFCPNALSSQCVGERCTIQPLKAPDLIWLE